MTIKEIILNKETRKPVNGDLFELGVDGENLQEKIVFKFEDTFVDGQARVEIELQDETKTYILIDKVDESYELPIKSVITKEGLNHIELVITQGTNDNEIPIFKSEKIPFIIKSSINAVEEAPEGYQQWIDIANAKINEMNYLMNDLQSKVESGYFNGKDALINGVNILELIAGNNITIEQEGNKLIISATGVAPYPDNVLTTSDDDIFMTSDEAYFVLKESE